MSKKLILLLGCVSLLILVACGDDGEPVAMAESVPESRPDEPAPFEFSVEIIRDDELATLGNYIEINYAMARYMFITEGLNLRFNFNQPVTDFSIIEVTSLEDGSFAKTGVLYEVGTLYPDRPLVLSHYFNSVGRHSFNWNQDSEIISDLPHLDDIEGMMPEIDPITPEGVTPPYFGHGMITTTGFYFTGPDGQGNWYIFGQNQINGAIIWSPFDWSHERDHFDIGEDFEIDPNLPHLDDVEGMMPEVDPIVPVDIRVVDASEGLHSYFEFNYAEARGEEAPPNTYTLLITPSELMPPEEPLRDFSIISINYDNGTPEVTGVLVHIGDLRSDKPLLIHSYFSDCTLPTSGFVFGYPRRYFMFAEDQSGSETGRFIVTEFTSVP